jgi:hypothetical protein
MKAMLLIVCNHQVVLLESKEFTQSVNQSYTKFGGQLFFLYL